MSSQEIRPGVGAAMLVWKTRSKDVLLLGHGHSSAESDVYALAGGHVENGENLLQAAIRETKEESGVGVLDPRLLTIYEFFNKAKHRQFVTVAFEGIWDGTPPSPEKGKRRSWDWVSLNDALSLPLFESDVVLLRNVKNGVLYDCDADRIVDGF